MMISNDTFPNGYEVEADLTLKVFLSVRIVFGVMAILGEYYLIQTLGQESYTFQKKSPGILDCYVC